MKILSVNIAKPKEVPYQNKTIQTSIFKQPIDYSIEVNEGGFTEDIQADTIHHGGIDKAVYLYGFQHYEYWQNKLKRKKLEIPSFGENLTIDVLDESQLAIGDHLFISDCHLIITQPRTPCYKLGILHQNPQLPVHFIEAQRPGIYCKVVTKGFIQKGNQVILQKGSCPFSIKELYQAFYHPKDHQELLNKALSIDHISTAFKNDILKKQ